MPKQICIYHDHCMDGFTAAWVVWRESTRPDNITFIPASYGSAPPDVTDAQVMIVDFSYPRETLLEMADKARWVTVLDHHKTAQEALEGLDHPRLSVQFDMSRSGARMAWDFLSPGNHGEPCPLLVRYVEDRDLWRWAMPQSREINAWLRMQARDFATWSAVSDQLDFDQTVPAEIGAFLLAQFTDLIGTSIDITLRHMTIGGHRVPVANLPPALASEAGNMLAEGNPFAAIYSDTPRGRQFSLRSTDAGLDVSEIAKALGGGGHRNAAGFLAPRNWEGEA